MLNIDKYQILRKTIPNVELYSLTEQKWYDWDRTLIPWSGSLYIGPNVNDVYYNVTGSIPIGYYKWTGSKWNKIEKKDAYDSYNIPLFLQNQVDEMGVMVSFDGNIEQVDQLVNFSYTQNGKTVTVYNTVNPNKLKKIVEQTFTINWGDGNQSSINVNDGTEGKELPYVSHTYLVNSEYKITISLVSPWSNQKLNKIVTVPAKTIIEDKFGTYYGITIPAYTNITGQTQNYLNDLDYTNNTGSTDTVFTYLAIGKSRVSEKKLYGENKYSGTTIGTDAIGTYTGYTIDNLQYKDYPDGYTMITGATSGFTREEVFNKLITRDEHFIGFIDEPSIYSDIFIERGKQSVMENNLRLGEIESTGELISYQNEYFIIKNQ